jgi:hypothetical protein
MVDLQWAQERLEQLQAEGERLFAKKQLAADCYDRHLDRVIAQEAKVAELERGAAR